MLTRTFLGMAISAFLASTGVQAAWSSRGPNVMYYWGQNSAGGSNTQASLGTYCESGQVDAVLLSFLHVFNVGGIPEINLSNACAGTYFPNTQLLSCPAVGADIKKCQDKGVKVILSLGGAAGVYGFTSDAQGQQFAQTIWNLFGGGSSDTRPFGDAVIDGVDLDIEGGSSTGYVAFVNALRQKFSSNFLIGAAPQCPFPDAILGSVLNSASFDYVNVQFYNNYCSATGSSFNFDTWDNWAKTTSPNKNVKIMLTVPGSSTAAGSGYVPMSTLQTIVPSLSSKYSSYGGVSVWDASQAWNNGGFNSQLYSLVHSGGSTPPPSSSSATKTTTKTTATSTKTTTTTAPTATSTPGSCPVANQPCSTQNQYACTADGKYAVCDHGKWVASSCPSNTVCIPTTDGTSIYCGYATGSGSTCPSASALEVTAASFGSKNGPVPRPYKASKVAAQLAVTSTDKNSFEAVINARRTTLTPFEKSVTIEFTTPSNIKFTESDMGPVRQVGNKVRIQAKNDYNESMTLVVKVKGSINSGVFVAPSTSAWKFK
ncbi:chitinase 2 [Rhizopus microsporus var. microsporus]|uniref:chitinase n=2 Tax=Rhizopus microsporus TaxID=58291 RepID=A0A2G4T9A7_RHIZD|nr:chitinase 2 [Rhizopus microsporus ATCC 52813]ORE05826.1 chitinase 2 [Rhizopus microsporus var. microsporus]PHZ17592.1 chitinase 2 [Rhizopus microsporus ATCC 52813]